MEKYFQILGSGMYVKFSCYEEIKRLGWFVRLAAVWDEVKFPRLGIGSKNFRNASGHV